MANLFEQTQRADFRPLAVRMRPRTLDEIYGQEAVVGAQSFLAAMIRSDTVPSLLLFGPPGTGKTT
ncbi:MAG: replication-associated recombination protein A, partial [Negativicoccus succinicivorans]|nr:replication-associated recombination protein A [Negativicoccus succinicivorans]